MESQQPLKEDTPTKTGECRTSPPSGLAHPATLPSVALQNQFAYLSQKMVLDNNEQKTYIALEIIKGFEESYTNYAVQELVLNEI